LSLLIDKTKSERGYTGTGRLITRILHTVAGVYPVNSRFVNTAEWDDPGLSAQRLLRQYFDTIFCEDFDSDHNTQWGRLYEVQDITIEWHGK
jgi:proteasome activator subunit 4